MRAVLLVMAMTGAAYAQAPGETTPLSIPPAPMTTKWGIGASLAAETLRPQNSGAKTSTGFGVVEVNGRYRLSPQFQVDLAIDLGGGKEGTTNMSLGGVFADGRYAFHPDSPWDWYLVGGIGAVSLAQKNAIDRDKSGRGALRIGAGGTHRWGHFALEAQLQLVGVTQNTDAQDNQRTGQAYWLTRYGCAGLALSAGATYEF